MIFTDPEFPDLANIGVKLRMRELRPETFLHGFRNGFGKAAGELPVETGDGVCGGGSDFVEGFFDHGTRQSGSFDGLDEVPFLDVGDLIMVALTGRHGEFQLLFQNLAGFQGGQRGEHIVKRSETEAAPGAEKDAEIFCVPVRRSDQPEDNLSLEKGFLIFHGTVAAFEQLQDIDHAGTASILVFPGWRDGQRLTDIFQRITRNYLFQRINYFYTLLRIAS